MTTVVEPKQREMVEVQPPELVKLTAPGQFVQGHLRAVGVANIKGDDVTEYLIEREDADGGGVVKLRSNADLRQKITKGMIDRFVYIEFVKLDETAGTAENAMKVFRVAVEKA